MEIDEHLYAVKRFRCVTMWTLSPRGTTALGVLQIFTSPGRFPAAPFHGDAGRDIRCNRRWSWRQRLVPMIVGPQCQQQINRVVALTTDPMLQQKDLMNKPQYQPYAWNVQKGVAVLSHHHLRQAAPILQIGEIFRSNQTTTPQPK